MTHLRGENVPKDITKAAEYLIAAAGQGNQYAQYALGKLYLSDNALPQGRQQATYWLAQSAAQGHRYAQFLLDRLDNNQSPAVLLSATRLLHHMSRVFQETPPPSNPTGPRVDSKLMQRIREKKITAGHKAESQTLSYCKEAFMEVRPPTQIPVRFPFCALDPANHKLPTYKIAGFPHDPRLSPKRVP